MNKTKRALGLVFYFFMFSAIAEAVSEASFDKKAWGVYFDNYEAIIEEAADKFNITIYFPKASGEMHVQKVRRTKALILAIRNFFIKIAKEGYLKDGFEEKDQTVIVKKEIRFLGLPLRKEKTLTKRVSLPVKIDQRREVFDYFAEHKLLFLKDGRADLNASFKPALIWEAYFLQSLDIEGMKNLNEAASEQYFSAMKLMLWPTVDEISDLINLWKAELGAVANEALGLNDPMLLLELCTHIPQPIIALDIKCPPLSDLHEGQFLSLLDLLIQEGLDCKGKGFVKPLAFFLDRFKYAGKNKERYINLIAALLEKEDPNSLALFLKNQPLRKLIFTNQTGKFEVNQLKKTPLAFLPAYQRLNSIGFLLSSFNEPSFLKIIGDKYLVTYEEEIEDSLLLSLILSFPSWQFPMYQKNLSFLAATLSPKLRASLAQFKMTSNKQAEVREEFPDEIIEIEGFTLISSFLYLISAAKNLHSAKLFSDILIFLLKDVLLDPSQTNSDGSTPLQIGEMLLQDLQEQSNSYIFLKEALAAIKICMADFLGGGAYDIAPEVTESLSVESVNKEADSSLATDEMERASLSELPIEALPTSTKEVATNKDDAKDRDDGISPPEKRSAPQKTFISLEDARKKYGKGVSSL